jgi:hypothetical protein
MSVGNDVLIIDVSIFCQEMVGAAKAYLTTARGSEPFESNFANLIRRHPNGLAPIVVGVPVIG